MTTSTASRILVLGATGQLGGEVARQLLSAGVPVRAFGRNAARLEALASLGAETVRGDWLDEAAVDRASTGVGQVFTSANSLTGRGASSPTRVDVRAHRQLCDIARRRGVRRLLYVSARGLSADSPVDYFRVKHAVEGVVRDGGVPYVVLRPSAFMEIWASQLIGDGIRDKGVATLFGDGRRVTNFIAVADVARFAVRILQREEVRNEVIDVGGPSNASYETVAGLVERQLGVTAKRRHVPVPLMRIGKTLVRPFNEVAARMMALGYFAATVEAPFDGWRVAAERFGVAPVTLEQYIAERFARQ